MPRHLFRHLRRCRTLLVLALCAWMALSSVAWAMPRHDACCPPTASMGMLATQHAVPDHDASHASTLAPDSCCTHAPASVPASMVPHVLHVQADGSHSQARRQAAPQPVYDPPLRPPVA
ncbi:hypothetical protein [Dyella japonica]|uniref:DUF2946 domain-containing protein n=1 Tax=Dyella japonica A8 TaxID=1217721 RepID=A0A075K3T5_9GAMM|nr:hypothetical protein [Dyella japonica]AIF48710.1 hypothetical protein HY57_16425 [Dyella japonica A8]